MDTILEPDVAPASIEVELSYYSGDGASPVSLVAAPGGRDTRVGATGSETHRVTLHNGRPTAGQFLLDRDGFRFVSHPTQMTDFYDQAEIERVYYPEMETLVKAQSGAKRVVVFDHTLRTEDEGLRERAKIREVVRRVHNDYTEASAPKRVRDLMGGEAEALLKGRFAIIQVWRPIRHPVETWPLAICDARSLDERDLVVTERRYQNRTGQTYAIHHNEGQYWYWFPRMRRDEALVFKVYESLRDGRARWTAHTAFDDPTSPPNARPRESIEIRTLAFF
ncbi:MAG TPA: CmcJ/NvfI family oxidoreductase [Stellaceae bacterium]|jgi:hypothetical protein|nr:CmcJ/NvfI family oxidoreductase [Stellaceae bacterium]